MKPVDAIQRLQPVTCAVLMRFYLLWIKMAHLQLHDSFHPPLFISCWSSLSSHHRHTHTHKPAPFSWNPSDCIALRNTPVSPSSRPASHIPNIDSLQGNRPSRARDLHFLVHASDPLHCYNFCIPTAGQRVREVMAAPGQAAVGLHFAQLGKHLLAPDDAE